MDLFLGLTPLVTPSDIDNFEEGESFFSTSVRRSVNSLISEDDPCLCFSILRNEIWSNSLLKLAIISFFRLISLLEVLIREDMLVSN